LGFHFFQFSLKQAWLELSQMKNPDTGVSGFEF
jgi:hypothetical protein